MFHGDRYGSARTALDPRGGILQRHALRALAVDFHDAVTGADARGYGGTVGHGAEHQKLLGLGVLHLEDSDADKLLIQVVVELRFVGRADVIGVLVQRRFQDVAKFRLRHHALHRALKKLQVVDRPVVAPGDEVEALGQHAAIAAAGHVEIANPGDDADRDQPVEVAARHGVLISLPLPRPSRAP